MAADVEKGLERVRREAGSPVGRGPPPTGNEGAWSVEWGHSKPGLSCSSGTASLTSTPESLPGPISHLPARRRAQSALTQATSTRGGVLPLGCCPRPLEPLPCLCTLTWSRSVSCSCSTLIDPGCPHLATTLLEAVSSLSPSLERPHYHSQVREAGTRSLLGFESSPLK